MHALVRLAAILTDETFCNPSNIEEEKEKFFKDKKYNPQFTYRKLDFDPDALRDELERMLQAPQDDDDRLSQLMQERARDLMKWLDLMQARGTDAFTPLSIELFGTPDTALLREAERLVASPRGERVKRSISDAEARDRLQASLDDVATGWRAIIDGGLVSEAHCNPQLHLLRIKRGARFTPTALRRLVVHEVGVHARRAANAEQQACPVFVAGTAGYLETEEGLALYREDIDGCFTPKRQRQVGGRVIAIATGLEHGFAETYAQVRSYVDDDDEAFTLTLRAKRGLADTGQPGGWTKDLLYLKGYLRVKALPDEDRELLSVGKVSYHQLPIIKELVTEGKVTVT